MKLNKEIKIEDLEKAFNLKSLGNFFGNFLSKRFQLLGFLVAAGCLLFLILIWNNYIFQSDWSELEIQKYVQAKKNKADVSFNRSNFQDVIDESENRMIEFERSLDNLQDIFRLKQ